MGHFLFGLPGDLKFTGNVFDGPETFTVVKRFHDTEPRGLIQLEDFCDGEVPLEKIQDGFAAIRRKEAVKITVVMPH